MTINLIDPKLTQAGYVINHTKGLRLPSTVCIETPVTFSDGRDGYVDYVIFGRNGKPLAVIEAKKTVVNEEAGRAQACFYADALEREYGVRPVIYYTNGYNIKIIDGKYPARTIYGFHRMEELEYLIERRNHVLKDVKVKPEICDRYYQKEAIDEVIEHITKKNSRSLIVLATGTGKTRVSCALSDIFIRNNYVKRILFLADRKNLVKQAKEDTFDKLISNVSTSLIADGVREGEESKSRIVFSTYQSMISIIKDVTKCPYGVGHFDLIIIDEAHRSLFNKYADIFKYFDALMIGLTATPRADVGKNTYKVFNLETESPNYEYDLIRGVQDEYLTYYRALDRTPNLLRNGLVYETLTEDEKEQYEEKFGDDESVPDKIEGKYFYSTITNIDTIRKVLRTLMDEGIKVNNGDELGKTIIFAKDHKHAVLIMEEFRKMYPELCSTTGEGGVDYCVVIDNQIKYNEHLQREFKEKQNIRIVVSVDMMDTGVDIPEVVNLVFFKRIASKTKFFQMIGRGTRLCKNLNVLSPSKGFFERNTNDNTRSIYKDKQGFLIFDICNVFEFFKMNPDGAKTESNIDENLSDAQNVLFSQMKLYANLQRNYNTLSDKDKTFADELRNSFFEIVLNFNTNYFNVQNNFNYVEKYRDLSNWYDINIVELKKYIIPLYQGEPENPLIKKWDMLCNNFANSKFKSQKEEKKFAGLIFTLVYEGLLKTKLHIPTVKEKEEQLKFVASEDFINTKSPFVIDEYRNEIRELIPFIDKTLVESIISDFDDYIIGNDDADNEKPFIKTNADDSDNKIKLSDFDSFEDKIKCFIESSNEPFILKMRKLEQFNSEDVANIIKKLKSIDENGYKQKFNGEKDLIEYLRKNIIINEEVIDEIIKELNFESNEKDNFVKKVFYYFNENGMLSRKDFTVEPLNEMYILTENELFKLISILKKYNVLTN